MPLSVGDKIGHFEVLSLLGQGGMGEVYRARDTKLKRDVALKVLPDAFARDPERLARFQREAEVLASLNHSNIAQIYGVEERALAMELVDGEAPKGPMPFDEAWKIASQIAAALEYAHDKGIMHRDLKPANIKVTPDGTVKLLDFGLAKAFTNRGEARTSASDGPENSPTLTIGATEVGVILGTAAYMPPEQAKGKTVDKRADIWAFGVVFYELLTGERLFKGEDVSETLAQVLTKQPELEKIPTKARKLLARCLEKDPKKRLRDIGDAADLLDAVSVTAPPASQLGWVGWVGWGVAGLAVVCALGVSFIHFRELPPNLEITRFATRAPDKTSFGLAAPAISPDGRTLAFTANGLDGRSQIWVKPMNSLEAHVLAGTDGVGSPLFWSPDGRSLAFAGAGLAHLMKIEVAGGPAQTLCPTQVGPPIGAWSPVGVIIYRASDGLMQVPAGGGTCAALTKLDSKRMELRHTSPSFLPDGRHFLYLRVASKEEDSGVYVGSLDSKPDAQSTRRIMAGASPARYVATADASHGYLLFLRDGALMAQPFDAGSLSPAGDAVLIAEHVGASSGGDLSWFTASVNGTLVYRGGQASGDRQLTWYDRSGKSLGPLGAPGLYNALSISPDGKRVAFDRPDIAGGNDDIWLDDLAQGTTNRFTFDPARDTLPVWSPNGSRIVWSSERDGPGNLYQKPSNLSGDETVLLKSPERKFAEDWSPDGRFLLYSAASDARNMDLWVLPLQGKPKPTLFLGTRFVESQGRFSPDGRYIAYVSNESGRNEVYVRPFSSDGNSGGQQMISQGGGTQPLWRHDGKELFYIAGDSKVMAIPVSTNPAFQRSAPVALFTAPTYLGSGESVSAAHRWDVMPDGKKFLIISAVGEVASQPITVIMNWMELLKK